MASLSPYKFCFLSFWVFKYSETAVVPRDSILETEVEWLNSIKADLVVLRRFSELLLNYRHFNQITLAIPSATINLEGSCFNYGLDWTVFGNFCAYPRTGLGCCSSCLSCSS